MREWSFSRRSYSMLLLQNQPFPRSKDFAQSRSQYRWLLRGMAVYNLRVIGSALGHLVSHLFGCYFFIPTVSNHQHLPDAKGIRKVKHKKTSSTMYSVIRLE